MSNTNETTAAASTTAHVGREAPPSLLALALGSVGVVYGDIGTSPLYAFREAAIAASNNQMVTREVVLGVLSLIVWALIITVTLKYVLILLRADNNGEGGTLSLTALATRALGRRTAFVFIVGVIGASMFLGNSVITPAISVLSAVEGLKLASPARARRSPRRNDPRIAEKHRSTYDANDEDKSGPSARARVVGPSHSAQLSARGRINTYFSVTRNDLTPTPMSESTPSTICASPSDCCSRRLQSSRNCEGLVPISP